MNFNKLIRKTIFGGFAAILIILTSLLVFAGFYLIYTFFQFPDGIFIFWYVPEHFFLPIGSIWILVIDVGLFFKIIPLPVGGILILILSAYLLCLILLFRGPKLTLDKKIERVINENKISPLTENGLFSVIFLLGTLFILVTILAVLLDFFHVPRGSPSLERMNPFIRAFSALFAAINEELWFRSLLIGPILGIYYLIISKRKLSMTYAVKLMISTIVNPERTRAKLNRQNLWRIELLIILTSSISFGFWHWLSGTYFIGFVPMATLAGFILAYVFLRFGLKGSFFLHATWNLFFSVLDLSIERELNLGIVLGGFIFLFCIVIGFLSLIFFVNLVYLRIKKKSFCKYCGEPLFQYYNYCPRCGKLLNESMKEI